MCQCTFINCNKYATLVQDVAGKSCVCGAGGMWENSVHPAQLCCEPNTALREEKRREEKRREEKRREEKRREEKKKEKKNWQSGFGL